MDELSASDEPGPEGPATRWTRAPDVLWRDVTRGVVLLPPGGDPLRLSITAAALWALLREPTTTGEAASALAVAFDAEEPKVLEDVSRLVAELADLGVIRPAV